MGGYIVLYEGALRSVKHTLPLPGQFKERAYGTLDAFDVQVFKGVAFENLHIKPERDSLAGWSE